MGAGEFTAGVNPACDGLAYHPGGVEILLVALCYGNRDKLRSDGPLVSYADLTYHLIDIVIITKKYCKECNSLSLGNCNTFGKIITKCIEGHRMRSLSAPLRTQ